MYAKGTNIDIIISKVVNNIDIIVFSQAYIPNCVERYLAAQFEYNIFEPLRVCYK